MRMVKKAGSAATRLPIQAARDGHAIRHVDRRAQDMEQLRGVHHRDEDLPLGPNLCSFIGHSDIRTVTMGLERSTDDGIKPTVPRWRA